MAHSSQVLYIEPNYNTKAESILGTPNYVHDLEDYCVYVDLQVEIFDRSIEGGNTSKTLLFGWKTSTNGQTSASFNQGSKIKFDGANGKGDGYYVLTTNYLNQHYYDVIDASERSGEYVNSEMFGISSIDIKYDSYTVPVVNISFVDIKGGSLFMPEELRHHVTKDGVAGFSDEDIAGSFFKSFFTFPYPKFTLRVKGFYGDAVSYQLTCSQFNAKFDSKTGSFNAQAELVGYAFSLLNDISLNAIMSAPLSDYAGMEYWHSRGGALSAEELDGYTLNTEAGNNGSAFVIMDSHGRAVPMPTLSRLLSLMDDLTTVFNEHRTETETATENVDESTTILNVLGQVKSRYSTMVNSYLSGIGNESDMFSVGDVVISSPLSPKDGFVVFYSNELDEYGKMKINRLIDKFNAANVGILDNISIPYLPQFKVFENALSDEGYITSPPFKSYIEENVPSLLSTQKDSNGNDYVVLSRMIQENIVKLKASESDVAITRKNAAVFGGAKFLAEIDDLIQSKQGIQTEAQKEITRLETQSIEEVFGFVPTVKNIMAIIMAHLETLIHIVYTATQEVNTLNSSSSPRTLADLGMYDADLTDVKIGQNETVPPWPKITKEDPSTGEYFDTWIGDFPKNGRNQPEAEAVRGLLNGSRVVSNSVNEAAATIVETEATKQQKCESRLPLPIIINDFLDKGNPFGTNGLNLSTPENTIDDVVSKVFIRMFNVFYGDYNITKNSSPKYKYASVMGKADGANFFRMFGMGLSREQRQAIADFLQDGGDALINKMNSTSSVWSSSNSEVAMKLINFDNIKDANSVAKKWIFDDKCFPTQNISVKDYLTNGINSIDENYCYIDDDFVHNTDTNGHIKIFDTSVRVFQNPQEAIDKNYLNLRDSNVNISSEYSDYFSEKFNSEEMGFCKETIEEIYGDGDQTFTTDNDYFYSDLSFGYKFCVTDDEGDDDLPEIGRDINTEFASPNSGTLTKYSKRESNLAFPVLESDNNELHTIDGKNEKEDFDDGDQLRLEDIDTIDIFDKGFVVPTVQFYDEGEHNAFLFDNTPTTGCGLFTSKVYYACKNVYGKSLLFLDNLRCNSITNFVDRLCDREIAYVFTTEVAELLAGGYLYRMKIGNDAIFDFGDVTSEYINNANEYLGTDIQETLRNKDSIKKLSKLSSYTKNQLINKFLDWTKNEFPYYDRELSINIEKDENGNLNPIATIKRFRKLILDESKTNTWDLLKNEYGVNMNNYMKVNQGGCLFLREDCEVARRLTNFVKKPILIVKKYDYSVDKEYVNRYEDLIKVNSCKSYLKGFAESLRQILLSEIQLEENNQPSQLTKDPITVPEIEIALYKYLKILHDKWLGSTHEDDWKRENFFDKHFVFIDSYYYDISHKAIVNPIKMAKLMVRSQVNKGYSLISFITTMLQENNLNFQCVQNFIDLNNESYVSAMKRMFEPTAFVDIDHIEDQPYFITIYKGEGSNKLNIQDSEYKDDGIMLDYGNENNWPKAIKAKGQIGADGKLTDYPIPAFGVSFGSQYQSYFTDIDVGMDSAVATEQSLQAQYLIANMNSKTGGENSSDKENTTNTFALGQDLFTIYANNSYTCSVTMMGCAWVQPLMYFVLLNVPLFRGSYLIYNVTHHIEPGNMVTTFKGNRMANSLTPFVKNYFNKINDASYSSDPQTGYKQQSKIANANNDCPYAVFPLETKRTSGGVKPSILRESGGYSKYAYSDKDGDRTRYDTLLEALTCTVYAENKANNKLGAELISTVIFNRWKKNGEDWKKVFVPKQIAYRVYSRNASSSEKSVQTLIATDDYKRLEKWVENIFINTPMVIVGEHTNVIKGVTIYQRGTLTGEISHSVQITQDMVQKMDMYCSKWGYDKRNLRPAVNQPEGSYESHPENWRNQEYLCHQDLSEDYGHVLVGDKVIWTPEPTSEDADGIDDNGVAKIANAFMKAVQRTMDASTKIKGVLNYVALREGTPHTLLVSCSEKSSMDSVFDIMLNAYGSYIYELRWCGDSSGELASLTYPSKIVVSIQSEAVDSTKIKVNIFKNGAFKSLNEVKDGTVNNQFFKIIGKKYKVDTEGGLRALRVDIPQMAGVFDEEIRTCLKKNAADSCETEYSNLYANTAPIYRRYGSGAFEVDTNHPYNSNGLKGEALVGPPRIRLISPKSGGKWEDKIKGGVKDCGCTKTVAEMSAIVKNTFGEQIPQYKSDMKQYLKTEAFVLSNGKKTYVTLVPIAMENFKKAYNEITATTNFQVISIGSWYWRCINNKKKPESKSMSNHSYGVAIDINGTENKFFKTVDEFSGTDNNYTGLIRTVNSDVVKIMKKYGFGWGGYYGDTMHFSLFNGT